MPESPYVEAARLLARELGDTSARIRVADEALIASTALNPGEPIFLERPQREELCRQMERRQGDIIGELETFDNSPKDAGTMALVRRYAARAAMRPARTLGLWLAMLALLYALLAMPVGVGVFQRDPMAAPDVLEQGDAWVSVSGITLGEQTGAVLRAGQSTPDMIRGQPPSTLVSAVFALRGYAARMVGTLPQQCFGDLRADGTDDWRQNGTPLLVQLAIGASGNPPGQVGRQNICTWWRHGGLHLHALAAISPDVGVFQKLALLVFLLGWRGAGLVSLDLRMTRRMLASQGPGNPLIPDVQAHLFPGRQMVVLGAQSGEASVVADRRGEGKVLKIRDPYPVYVQSLTALCNALAQSVLASSLSQRIVRHIERIAHEGLDFGERAALIEQARKSEAHLRETASASPWYMTYILWFLPTIGFLGTIYGISLALIAAAPVLSSGGGDFQPVVESLGVAFDTTAFALILLALLTLRDMRNESQTAATVEDALHTVRDRLLDRLEPASRRADSGLLRDGLRALAVLRAVEPEETTAEADDGEAREA